MNWRISSGVLLLFSAATAHAQSFDIKGVRIGDKFNQAAIPDVTSCGRAVNNANINVLCQYADGSTLGINHFPRVGINRIIYTFRSVQAPLAPGAEIRNRLIERYGPPKREPVGGNWLIWRENPTPFQVSCGQNNSVWRCDLSAEDYHAAERESQMIEMEKVKGPPKF